MSDMLPRDLKYQVGVWSVLSGVETHKNPGSEMAVPMQLGSSQQEGDTLRSLLFPPRLDPSPVALSGCYHGPHSPNLCLSSPPLTACPHPTPGEDRSEQAGRRASWVQLETSAHLNKGSQRSLFVFKILWFIFKSNA